MSTLASPISSRPARWSIATALHPGQRARTVWPISRIFTSAIGACASYSRILDRSAAGLVPHDTPRR